MAKKHGACEDCYEEAIAALLHKDVSDDGRIESVPGRFRIQSNRYQCEAHYEQFLHPERVRATLEPQPDDDYDDAAKGFF